MSRALLLCLAGCGVAIAQCAIPYDISRLNLDQVRAQITTDRASFFLYKRLLDLTPLKPKPGTLAPEFKRRLEAHPADARFTYLYGRALIGKDTPEAIVRLRRAVELDPKLPWTFTALAEIFVSPNFKDEPKVLESMHEFRKLCPANVEGFRYLNLVKDPVEAGELAGQLRPLLEAQTTVEDGNYWSLLWGAEFRAAPESAYADLRKRVARDVGRLESLKNRDSRSIRSALLEGYRLSEQQEAAEKIENTFDSLSSGFMKAFRAWQTELRMRTRNNITREEREAIGSEEAALAAEWVRQWPSSRFAWSIRLSALSFGPKWSKDDLEHAGERVIELDRNNYFGWSYVSEPLRVAQVWIRYGVRLKDSLEIAEKTLADVSLGPEEANDLTSTSDTARILASQRFGFDISIWDAMGAIVDASVQLNDLEKAHAMLGSMQRWLDDNQNRHTDPTSGYQNFQRLQFASLARVAAAEGHKLDALGYYIKAVSGGGLRDEISDRAAALWLEQGGSKVTWDLLTARPAPPPRPVPASTTTAAALPRFEDVNKPLTELKLRDLAGNTWTVEKLKGKRTFIGIWTTW